MKLGLFNGGRLGIVADGSVLDCTDLLHSDEARRATPGEAGPGLLHALIAGDVHLPSSERLSDAPRIPIESAQWDCPLPAPPKIVAAPVNYWAHKAEMEVEHTVSDLGVFLKARTSVVGPGGVVHLPYSDQRFDQEGELGVVIGRSMHAVRPDQALDGVFGYTCLLDMSLRSTEDRSTRKSFDTFTPLGPWIVTRDEMPDLDSVEMRVQVNGEVRQRTLLGSMIFDVATLVAYASSIMTLEAGDIIATGTPEGVGPVGDGDEISVHIDGLAGLTVTVSDAHAIPYRERVGAKIARTRPSHSQAASTDV